MGYTTYPKTVLKISGLSNGSYSREPDFGWLRPTGVPKCDLPVFMEFYGALQIAQKANHRGTQKLSDPMQAVPSNYHNYQGIGAAQSMKAGRVRKKKRQEINRKITDNELA